MNDKIVLTIAIPTYNRAQLLTQTLKSVLEQIEKGVEVIVVDNASTDFTIEEMQKYKDIESVRYIRKNKNTGMDGNFLDCIRIARGDYLHWLSDDDILLPGAISKILSLIHLEEPDYIHLNSFSYSKKFNLKNVHQKRIPIKDDIITCDKNVFMKYIGIYITFLSSTIIKRKNFLNIKNPHKFYGTYFMHAHITLTTLAGKNKKIIITNNAYIAAKSDNTGGYNFYEVWIKQYKRLLMITAVKSGFDKKAMEKLFVNDMKETIYNLILGLRTKENNFILKNRRILVENTFKYPSVIIKTYPVVFLPIKILRVLVNNRILQIKNKKGEL